MLQTIDFLDGRIEQTQETVDWFRKREAWKAIEAVFNRYPDHFDKSPLLLYRLADAQIKQGQQDKADQTVKRALENGGDAQAQALPLDLGPGESVVVPVCARVPRVAGDLRLSFGITQADEWFPQYSERINVSVIP